MLKNELEIFAAATFLLYSITLLIIFWILNLVFLGLLNSEFFCSWFKLFLLLFSLKKNFSVVRKLKFLLSFDFSGWALFPFVVSWSNIPRNWGSFCLEKKLLSESDSDDGSKIIFSFLVLFPWIYWVLLWIFLFFNFFWCFL